MKQLSSTVIDSINQKLAWIQDKSQNLVENSFILRNLDNIILFFISIVLVSSLFLPSEAIGMVALCIVGLTIFKLVLFKGQNLELVSCNLFVLIFLGFSIISMVNSTQPFYSLLGLSKTLIYLSFYFSVIQYFRFNKNKIVPVLFLIASLAFIESIIGLFQNSIGVSNISTWQDTSYVNPEDVVSRVYGTLKPYNPNLLGGYLIACFGSIIAFTALAFESKHRKSFIIGFIALLTVALTIFFTGCRGAYIALFTIVGGIIFASWHIIKDNEQLKKYWQWAVSSVVGISLLGIVCTPSILKRILSIFVMRQDSSTSFRMNVYHSSVQMLKDNWLLGIGTGNKTFREVYGLYMVSGFDALSSYCVFLEMAVESGIFALLAYLVFLFILLSSSIKSFLESSDIRYRIVLFSVAISIIAVMVHGLFDTIYFRPQVQFVYWILVSILVVLLQSEEKTV